MRATRGPDILKPIRTFGALSSVEEPGAEFRIALPHSNGWSATLGLAGDQGTGGWFVSGNRESEADVSRKNV